MQIIQKFFADIAFSIVLGTKSDMLKIESQLDLNRYIYVCSHFLFPFPRNSPIFYLPY